MRSVQQPTKILYVMDYFYTPNGGTERQVFELIRNLDRTRYEPRLIALQPTAYLAKEYFPCETAVLGVRKLKTPSTVLRLFQLSRHLRASGTRLVHTFFVDSSIVAPLFCKLAGARVITSRRDMGFWYNPRTLAALKFANVFVDRIVANCDAVRRNVHRREGFPEDRITVIYNGHDHAKFHAAAAPRLRAGWQLGPTDPIIGIVANISPIKRHPDLLKALTIIHQRYPNAALAIVGGGGEKDLAETRRLANDLGIANRVRITGSVHDTVPFIKHFDVSVLCSNSEGLSNAIIEYMGCGKATVCTDTGGNRELIKDGHNGFVVPVGDISKLAERILRILDNPGLRQQLEANARADIYGGNFSIRRMVDSHMALYSRLLNGNERHPRN